MKRHVVLLTHTALFLFIALQSSRAAASLPVTEVTKDVYAIAASPGCNVTVFVTEQGLLVVDASVSAAAEQLKETIESISTKPVRYLINTHHHDDHIGGNAVIGKGATVVAHAKSLETMLANLKPGETAETQNLPTKTFKTKMALKLGKEVIILAHTGSGHTSGDTVVVLPKQKVLITGDLFFNGLRPYIDVQNGSDTKNWVATIESLVKRYKDYAVIPGHGPVANTEALQNFANYLKALRAEVAKAIEAGKTRDKAVEAIHLDAFTNIQDYPPFGMTEGGNVGWVYDEMKRPSEK